MLLNSCLLKTDPAWIKELNPRQNSGWFYQAVFKKSPEGEVPGRYPVPALCWFGSTLATRLGLRAFDLSGLENFFFFLFFFVSVPSKCVLSK